MNISLISNLAAFETFVSQNNSLGEWNWDIDGEEWDFQMEAFEQAEEMLKQKYKWLWNHQHRLDTGERVHRKSECKLA